LTSVKPFYDVIYIVDTGSTDNSKEIARSFGCIVCERPWDFSFSNARNFALDQTRGEDYIGWVDCDDTLPQLCGEAMRRMVAMAEDRIAAYLMQVHIPPAPGADGFTIVDHLKLWRNNPLHRWEGRIHEQMLSSIYAAGGIVERTNLYVVHSGYDYTASGQKKKHDRDEYLLGLDESERPLHPFPKFNWGMSLTHWGRFAEAVVKLEECLELSKPQESTVRKAYALLGQAHKALGNLDAARHNIDTGLKLFPRDPELLFRAGVLYADLGDASAAEQFYLRLFNTRESGHVDSLDYTMCTYKAHFNLALSYEMLNRVPEAEVQLRQALGYNQNFVPAWYALGEHFLRQRRFDDAADIVRRLETLSPPHADGLRRSLAAARANRVI
jgi:tetratricopeptide (TPR) repeat protein